MVKKSRNNKTHKRPPPKHQFHITIGAAPTVKPYPSFDDPRQITLEHELRLVKAALLYADKATLCSMSTSMNISMLTVGTITTGQKVEFLRSLLPVISKDAVTEETLANWQLIAQAIDKKDKLDLQQLAFVQQFEEQIDVHWNQFTDQI